LFAPLLAQWSLAFGPAEYFALMVSPSPVLAA
jgi:putative tricarboxylic transport membrane protein